MHKKIHLLYWVAISGFIVTTLIVVGSIRHLEAYSGLLIQSYELRDVRAENRALKAVLGEVAKKVLSLNQ